MRRAVPAAFALIFVFATFGPSAAAKEGKKAGSAVLIPVADLKWTDVPDFPGVKMAVVQADVYQAFLDKAAASGLPPTA